MFSGSWRARYKYSFRGPLFQLRISPFHNKDILGPLTDLFVEWHEINIADMVAECPKCQHVRGEHQRPEDLSQCIEHPLWKWDMICVDLITSFHLTPPRFNYIWVLYCQLGRHIQLKIMLGFTLKKICLRGFLLSIISTKDLNLQHIFGNRLEGPRHSNKSYHLFSSTK